MRLIPPLVVALLAAASTSPLHAQRAAPWTPPGTLLVDPATIPAAPVLAISGRDALGADAVAGRASLAVPVRHDVLVWTGLGYGTRLNGFRQDAIAAGAQVHRHLGLFDGSLRTSISRPLDFTPGLIGRHQLEYDVAVPMQIGQGPVALVAVGGYTWRFGSYEEGAGATDALTGTTHLWRANGGVRVQPEPWLDLRLEIGFDRASLLDSTATESWTSRVRNLGLGLTARVPSAGHVLMPFVGVINRRQNGAERYLASGGIAIRR